VRHWLVLQASPHYTQILLCVRLVLSSSVPPPGQPVTYFVQGNRRVSGDWVWILRGIIHVSRCLLVPPKPPNKPPHDCFYATYHNTSHNAACGISMLFDQSGYRRTLKLGVEIYPAWDTGFSRRNDLASCSTSCWSWCPKRKANTGYPKEFP